MAHNARTESDATWTTGNYVPGTGDWRDLDSKISKAINGDLGGAWAPTTPIVIATDPIAGSSFIVNGPTLIDYGGSLALQNSNTKIQLTATTDWPRFGASHLKRSRTIITPCILRQASPLWQWANDPATGGVRSVSCTIQVQPFYLNAAGTIGTGTNSVPTLSQPAFLLPLRVHDGSRLVSATLTFRVPTTRTLTPVAPPQMRIIRVDAAGNVQTLKSTASGASSAGYVPVSSASSGAVWSNGGLVQSYTYVCDQNQTIDVSTYVYFAQIIEEAGALIPIPMTGCDGMLVRERKLEVSVVATTNITLSGTQTIDGYSAGNPGGGLGGSQDRVLLIAQTDPSQNGIWVASSGTWTRAPDLSTQSDFTPGFVVHALYGTKNAAKIFECVAPTNAQNVKVAASSSVLDGTPISFGRPVTPRGNIYHAVACAFDSIADMRFQ